MVLRALAPAIAPRQSARGESVLDGRATPFLPMPSSAATASPSLCCQAELRAVLRNERLQVAACRACGTLWGEHSKRPDGRPWDESYVPPEFAKVLRQRREIQAGTIAAQLQRSSVPTPILDYGTGQGVLLAELRRRGLDAYGCDLDLNARDSVAPRDRLLQVHEPWGMPREQAPSGAFRTLVMLDVLEHHHDPVAFLQAQRFEHVLLKLPNATGPAARLARFAAGRGRTGLLEQLFLVGENFPHRWLATRKGVRAIAKAAGYEVVREACVTEVGTELPTRMRGAGAGLLTRCALWGAGLGLGLVGPWWSDASVVLLRRRAQ